MPLEFHARHAAQLLKLLDRMAGEPVRVPTPVRYAMTTPGEPVNADLKKLGRLPDGGGYRVHGRAEDKRKIGHGGHSYAYLHHAVISYSRVVYSEILGNEMKET